MGRWRGVSRFFACVAGALACVGSSPPAGYPAHPPLPAWIREIDPHDSVDTLAQIRVLFNEPVIPLEAIESPDRQTKLKYFHVSPALPGRFIFLTPRMVGFQMDRALPLATRITVTMDRALADLRGDTLASDLTWSFETTPIEISNLPDASGGVSLDPTFTLVSNTELDLASLRDRTTLTRTFAENVPIDVEFQRDSPFWTEWPGTLFDPSLRNWYYTVKVRQALAKATDYVLRVAPGVRPMHGNMPSETSFAGSFRTYDPLAFGGLDIEDPTPPPVAPLGSRFGNLSLSLRFNNGLSYASALSHISISPRPRPTASPFAFSEGASDVGIDVNLLDPRTTYTFTIDSALTDVFGQQLGQRAKATFTTGDLYPDLWAIDGYHIFAPSLGLRLNLIARNLPGGVYQSAFRSLHPYDVAFNGGRDVLPDHAQWRDTAVHGRLNQTSDITLDVRKLLGREYGSLAYGFAVRIPGYQDEYWGWSDHPMPVYGVAQITDLGVYAQETPDAGIVRVLRLSDGSAVASASIAVYQIGAAAEGKNGPLPCASATTDEFGSASLTGAEWQRCLAGAPAPWGPPVLAIVAQSGGDWASVRTDAQRQLGGGWETGVSPRGTLFTDRQLYQPGETVTFTGIAYYEEAGNVHRDANARYALSLQSPDDKLTPLGNATTDEYGTFSVRVPLAVSASVGGYQLYADGRSGVRIFGEFTVAQFTPPNFEVHLSIDKAVAFGGDTVHLQSTSKYLFGVPMSNAKTAFHATRSLTRFSPPGWDAFTFGRDLWWFDRPPQLPTFALDISKTVDARGSARTAILVPSDLPGPVLYQVDATTTDVSNRSVADSMTFTALPSDAFIGIAAPWLGDAGKPMSVRAIVADHLGKALPGRGVTVLLQRVEYGGSLEQWHAHYVTVDSQTTTSAANPVTVSLVAPTAGTYRIHSNFAGSSNDVTATDGFVWVAGPGEVNWGNDADSGLKIRLDKKSYHAGDMATAVIEAPFVPADLYVSVVKHQLLYHTIVHVAGSAPEVRFTVTPDMLPNAEIEAVMVRQGVVLSRANAKSQSALIRFGSAALVQNLDDRYLHIATSPLHANVEPGSPQTLSFAVTGSDGRPARAQLAVMVVNDDIVQLTGYRPPNLVEIVYAGQPITSVVVDNRGAMLFEQPTEPTGRGLREMRVLGRVADVASLQSKSYALVPAPTAAPGSGGKHPPVRVRTNFLKLAYYSLAVRTDAHGMASVTFKTPDDLTRWRVFVEASGAVNGNDAHDYRFGYGESTFVSTKPLLTNPLLPQFARPGDIFDGGVSVTSGTGSIGMLSIDGQLSGPISFARGASHTALQAMLGQGTQAFRFPIEVSRAGSGEVQFTTLMGGASDAFRVPIILTQLETPEQVIDSGATTSRVRIPLRVDPHVDTRAGGLQLAIASTLLPQITVPAEQMLAEPCYTFLTEAAAQLTAAADLQILSDRYQQRFDALDLRAIAARNLDVYAKLQRPDGFDDWPGSRYRDPYANAYAAEALARAKQAGFAVDPGLLESATSVMRAVEDNPGSFFPYGCDEACIESARLHAMVALAALGERRTAHLPPVYAQRDKFGYVDRLVLARYLSGSPDWNTQAAALAQKLAETIYETGRYATVNMPDSWWWMWSQTENQAQAIRLYVSRPAAADFRDRLVRGLLAQRRKGSWSNTFDTAEALDALVDYLAVEKAPPNFDATASIDGRTVVAAHFAGYENMLRETEIGMASLPHGLSNIDLSKAGTGTLHYVVAYRYRLQGAQAGAFEGIRIVRRLHPVGDARVIDTFDVSAPRAPVRLPAARVYDVELEIIADHPLDQVVITDPLPAGMEAVDSSFKTATPYFQPLAGSWAIDYSEIYRDRVIAFADRLGAGVYTFHYLVRTVTPGTFLWPGADAHLEFAPEQFGRSASATLQISQ